VSDVGRFVPMQTESALRNLTQSYPYDAHEPGQVSLRGATQQVAEHLKTEVQQAVALAGVEVIDAKISHLAYAPEIAHAMLQRQQASAIISARQKIVDGAVGMVEMALERLKRDNIVELDNERKAQMISNLLVVLCGQREAQPIVNAGTIYQ
jgi:regulator of protease activity HflC (stomatin/prohibitin superfamily)